jgi:hypothetical protein
MSVLSLSSSRPLPDAELELITQLAVTLSTQMTRVHFEELEPAIAAALRLVAEATRVEACQLIEFTELGTPQRAHVPTRRPSTNDAQAETPVPDDWVIERLARGELVVISRPEELPREAMAVRGPTGLSCILGVPASVAGRVVCALVIQSDRLSRRWPQPLVERLQLVSEILGAALQRRSHENALRSSVAEIQRLTPGSRQTTSV